MKPADYLAEISKPDAKPNDVQRALLQRMKMLKADAATLAQQRAQVQAQEAQIHAAQQRVRGALEELTEMTYTLRDKTVSEELADERQLGLIQQKA